MIFFLITGATRGIGKAITMELNARYGSRASFLLIARNRAELEAVKARISGPTRILDLNLAEPVRAAEKLAEALLTADVENYEKLFLINNAGVLAPVGKIGALDNREIESNIRVNLIAPIILTNTFLRWAESSGKVKLILNISSGAGRFPIVSWGGYCAAKAGLDMFSRTVAEEKRGDLRILSVAPGIIETDMQREIRNLEPDRFPLVAQFRRYKSSGSLKSPEEAAKEIADRIESPGKDAVIISL